MMFDNEMYDRLFNTMPLGISLNKMDGVFVECNQTFLEMIGYTQEELSTLSYWDLTPKEYDRQEETQLVCLKERAEYGPYEKEFFHKNGYRINVLLQDMIITDDRGQKFIWSTIQDVTHSKKAELVLNKAQELGNIGHWHLDLIKNELSWSDETYRIFGLEPQEFAATYDAFLERIYSDDKEAVDSAYSNSVVIDQPYQIEHRVIRPDGTIRYVIERCEHFHGKDGSIIGSIGTVLDITERKLNENALIKAKEASETANIAKSAFIAHMSHELRTPLNAILGFSKKMSKDSTLDEEYRKNLQIINSSGEHLLKMINEILDMSKIEAGEMKVSNEVIDVFQTIQDASALMSLQAENKALRCHLEMHKNVSKYIKTDAGKLKQILLNLIGNAIKFTDHGSITLEVAMKKDPLDPERKLLEIAIEDSGCGIDTHMLEDIFKPFIQNDGVKKVEGGTGLGLSITRELVRLLGGTIEVKSTVGKGSRFLLSIPIEVVTKQESKIIDQRIQPIVKSQKGTLPITIKTDYRRLPKTVLKSILDAAKKGSGLVIKKELENIKEIHSDIYDELSSLLKKYDFATIITLLKDQYE